LFGLSVRTAAGLPAAVLLSGAVALAGPPEPAESAAACRITPAVLDVSRPAGPLTVRIELTAPPSPAEAIEPGVYISSVNGVRLPAPSATAEGIGERVTGRAVEEVLDPPARLERPNGRSALVVRFDRPSDGNPTTREDGDAGDILAMLMSVPDGQTAPICVAGRVSGAIFECCDMVEVRNRGLRDLPRGLTPPSSP
jgi:hypothetical protein